MNKLSTGEWGFRTVAVLGLRLAFKIGVLAAGIGAVTLWLPPRIAADRVLDHSRYVIGDGAGELRVATRAPIEAAAEPQEQASSSGSEELVVAAEQITSSARIVRASTALVPDPGWQPDALSRLDIVRALQRELGRLGCYSGDPDGDWGPGSKRAMATFLERANASLPIDEPDPVLLSLVQGHTGAGCRGRAAENAPARVSDAAADAGEAGLATRRVVRAVPYRPMNEKSWRERAFDR